ncbi:extracellular solute-binding protein [Nocardioides sp. WL0053]|jgi:arabinogalactan oligomer / maltooligosaccharide transport system substrate-binding protein|uniref:Extracellular solute-binding protein n=1 Tax=Nocardioides jiangsuensis TaxID=2866161 RepID=A0ABS7RQY0_9ACTN|nr:extracellular solute-binding protein [Nocardioides jiangsuensis]MBY9076463.1 extracellular solute-binding protein [Nocardioides jiangsuensis]
MRRIAQAGALVAAVSLLATACGSGEGDTETNTDSAPQASEVSGSLTWWDTSDPTNEGPAFDALIKKFEAEYPKVDIKRQPVPFGEAQNKFKTAAEAGSGAPDILRAEVAWVPEFASLGYLYALDGTAALEDSDDYFETPLSSNVFDGKTYGVPQVTDSLALLYNKKLFEQAGIDSPPTTWDEVATAAEALKSKAKVDGIFLNPAGYFMLPFMYGEGGDLVDTDAQQIVVDSEENANGLQAAVDLVEKGAAPKPPAADGYAAMMTAFNEGKVGMIINGPWEVNNIRNAENFGGVENLGIAAVPAGSETAGAPVGGHNYVVYSGMDEKKADAAIAFINFMNSAESQAFLADELGLLPTRKSAYDIDSVKNNDIVSAFKPVVDAAVARPWIPEGGQFFAALDTMAVEVLVQGEDPKTALDKVAKTYKSEVVPEYSSN